MKIVRCSICAKCKIIRTYEDGPYLLCSRSGSAVRASRSPEPSAFLSPDFLGPEKPRRRSRSLFGGLFGKKEVNEFTETKLLSLLWTLLNFKSINQFGAGSLSLLRAQFHGKYFIFNLSPLIFWYFILNFSPVIF